MKIKPNTGFKVTVPKPWYVLLTGDGYPTEFCKIGLAKQDCSVWASNTPNVLILTDDPNAPAVNVILEETSWPTSCP